MDKKKAIELLKQALNEIPHLKELHYEDQEVTLWCDKVRSIIKAALDSDDLGKFSVGSWKIRRMFPDGVYQQEYLEEHLPKYETALKSIIKKYELLGIEEKHTTMDEPKNTAELPLHLFDEMQFHSKVIAVSRELFKDGHYRDAIYRAFVEVNNSVKAKSGKSELDGKALMSTVFSPNNPVIKLNNLKTQTDKDEQEGFMYLYMGAMQGIRNPKAHENLVQNNPYIALKLLGFASLLIETISFWEVGDA